MIEEIKLDQLDPIIPPLAITFVKIVPELSGCGRYAFGSWDILINTNDKNRSIRVQVLTKWKYENRPYEATDFYNTVALSRLNLGCDFWRGDFVLQEFDRKIVDAFYLT